VNERDLVWLAGLCEGEATFDLHRGKYPRIRVAMTDRDVVGRAALLFDSTIRMTLRPAPNKATFHAEISGEKAAAVMRLLLPHMGARRSAKIGEILGRALLRDGDSRTGVPGPALARPPAVAKLTAA
jgi:hypothetical protein